MSGCIVGWAHTKFGKHEGVELETLIVDAATEALVDAGVAPVDVDEIDALLTHSLSRMSVRDTAATVAAATGAPRKEIYRRALELSRDIDPDGQ